MTNETNRNKDVQNSETCNTDKKKEFDFFKF